MATRGFAIQGEAEASRRSLATAESAIERLDEDEPAQWINPFDEASLAGEAAQCFEALGDRRQAEKQARRVLELRNGDRVRGRAFGQLTTRTRVDSLNPAIHTAWLTDPSASRPGVSRHDRTPVPRVRPRPG